MKEKLIQAGWRESSDGFAKTFRFADFDEAFGFMNRVAEVARRRDHHPEFINIYDEVRVTLVTHDAGWTVTEKDVSMAQEIEDMLVG